MTESIVIVQQQCGSCVYFQEDQYDTGYCRRHEGYVLKSMNCLKWGQRPSSLEGGGVVAIAESRDTSEVG